MTLRFTTVTLVLAMSAAVARGQVEEYQVKAAFLYNFAKFVEWPAQNFKNPTDPIVICVLGRNPFGNALEEATSGKVVEGRGFAVREIAEAVPGCNCQMIFVSASERKRAASILEKLKSTGILTVGEMPGFAAEGAVINLRLESGKVRFEINLDAAAQEHLKLSSKLLALSEIVKNERK